MGSRAGSGVWWDPRVELRDLPRGHEVLERVLVSERRPQEVRVHDHVRHRVDERAVLRRAVAIARRKQVAPDHADGCCADEARQISHVNFLTGAQSPHGVGGANEMGTGAIGHRSHVQVLRKLCGTRARGVRSYGVGMLRAHRGGRGGGSSSARGISS